MSQFKKDVIKGLSSEPKFLSSKYFYDKIGDDLFVQITGMPEYYLTRSEFEIFSQKTEELINAFEVSKHEPFELIELGAGDATKTKELLKDLLNQGYNFDYMPIDISHSALTRLKTNLSVEMPTLNVVPKHGDYFDVLSSFKSSKQKKVILFLGSNIGNLSDDLSAKFLNQLDKNINSEDVLLLGVDLIKDADIVLPAYNDSQGLTSKFNLNLLDRINKELNADLDVLKFKHSPEYTKEEGIAKSYLESKENQTISIGHVEFEFKAGEKIHTEISRKYNDEIIKAIFRGTNFMIMDKIMDSKSYFADYILKKI